LDRYFGDDAFYVHLKRDETATAKSYAKRIFPGGIIPAYASGILFQVPQDTPYLSVSYDYCDTVNSNIDLFLKDKTKKMEFNLETAKEDFEKFWNLIGAEGNLEAGLKEFGVTYNASAPVVV